ncbi:MAG: hypothetical protein K0S29_332 [Gammaproteobacteria bacterium]|jgi:predicted GH43/DUF377 family glycosyl hydrolase|nr:hypothetical protein [Gammaproteobacteria bacterium]
MKWKKLGRVFVADNHFPWMISHAANPIAEDLGDDIYRIYFNCRDQSNKSNIGFVEINILDPLTILDVSEKPVLAPGEIGLFDDSGVSLACINSIDSKKYLYYLGWNLAITVPWRNSIGLAIFDENQQCFKKYGKAPIIDRSTNDPYSLSYPFVLKDQGIYRMWYGSHTQWGKEIKDMIHVLKYAESEDGINWKRTDIQVLNFKSSKEYAFSRPWVIKENNIFKMWYSYRGDTYRIGYAESKNGIDWIRKDEEAGIDVSKDGWDNEMICYPSVFTHKSKTYMLYCGNDYGKTGFGLAVLETDNQ